MSTQGEPASGQQAGAAPGRRGPRRRPINRAAATAPSSAATAAPSAAAAGAPGATERPSNPRRQANPRQSGPRRPLSPERIEARRASVPTITYPADLPVSQKKDDIAAAIRDHQVVIIAGETGSGKTTQIPKICLELGRGVTGMIGHTQPRRIAARAVADRIADELGTQLGEVVGYTVRFTDQVGPNTLVKLMTDGILLAELANDRDLSRYDTIIIDEAHERSLNIDFILGCLKQLLPRRPDLKVIITSATIDPERFSQHFDDAPIIEVSGRTYPVEVRYRPLLPDAIGVDDDEATQEADEEEAAGVPRRRSEPAAARPPAEERDLAQGICDAVAELVAEGSGDILVFCSGEREIRDAAEAITGMNLRDTEILPLYARLSAGEQQRVFASHTGRRVVLATNVAETSLTVPGIKYVIDPGTARISRYSHRLKVQRLPIERISQASANQRKGRCGRTSDGICIRLYAEDDFTTRDEFTDPEILRTNLAGVILQMTAYRLGDIATFPFIDPPDKRNIADGVALLQELGAFEARPTLGRQASGLTALGRKLAVLPVDPRMARMVIEGDRNGCVREVMIIAAALSIVDPRERPTDKREQSQQKHARFADPTSDFLALLNLWNYLQEQQRELSGNQFRRLCRADFLNYLRVREWQDIFAQLRQTAKQIGITVPPATEAAADPIKVHQALLSGLLSHVGFKDPEAKGPNRFEYLGARGARFAIAPGSSLFKSAPRWIFAAELVETSRLWGRVVARIEPEWIEPVAAHLVKRTYSEPHWERKQAAVIGFERVTLYGLPIVTQRRIQFSRVDPALCRELFIRNALVEGDWETHHKFFAENQALREEVEELEHRVRRRDILVDDETLYAFYDARIPDEVVSGRHFDGWWKRARHTDPDLLSYEKAMLLSEQAKRITAADYPDAIEADGVRIPLTYQFEPGTAADGVTAHVPLPVLVSLRADRFDWQVPGMRLELVTALIKALPKSLRRLLVPAPDRAAAVLERVDPEHEPLLPALERELHRGTGAVIRYEDWDWSRVPDHLRITYRVTDTSGKLLAEGKDLAALREQLRPTANRAAEKAALGVERRGLTSWTIGTLERVVQRRSGAYTVSAYPALVDEKTSVAVGAYATSEEAARAMAAGTRRLLLLTIPSPVQAISARLSNADKLTLMRNPANNVGVLIADCLDAAVDRLVAASGGPAWDEPGFTALRDAVRGELHDAAYDVIQRVRGALAAWQAAQARLDALGSSPRLAASLADARTQLAGLVYPGFVTATGADRLADLARYLRALDKRLERLPLDPARDDAQMATVEVVQEEYEAWLGELPSDAPSWPEVRNVRWMIEELRVNLFAQAIGTPYPISEKRIYRAMDSVAA